MPTCIKHIFKTVKLKENILGTILPVEVKKVTSQVPKSQVPSIADHLSSSDLD